MTSSGQNLRVLVIEDEAPIRRFLRASLETQDMQITEAETGREGLSLSAAAVPDLILLDLGLPDIDGLEVLKRLREFSSVPVVVLSAREKERDKVTALDSGADDYLTKPFSVGELLARIRVALRHRARAAGAPASRVEVGNLVIDLDARRVSKSGAEIRLTPNEYRLLACLARHAGRVVTQKELLKEGWATTLSSREHYVRIYIHQLRQKLEDDPARPKYLISEPWVGYRLKIDD
ncbi:MAG: response regulator [Candidatus Sumerlaeaceae bacterium]|nr:response regulator [Candidatus Sumerlaeaceae bacterium]